MPFMRPLIFIILVLNSIVSFGQSEFEKQYSSEVCSCMESKQYTAYNADNFVICIQQVFENDSAQVIKEYERIYGDTLFSDSRHFGNDLYKKIRISMVSECKPYAIFIDSLRYNELKNLNQDSLKIKLKNLDTIASVKHDINYYNQRSLLFFQLRLYDSVASNSSKVLQQDSNNVQALYFKGWVNEIKGNYDEAMILYDKVASITKEEDFLIFSALARRKKNGM
jgi:tetratricopeptide (TPR) repeat protein